MKHQIAVLALLCASLPSLWAKTPAPQISGDYLEIRTCDVYTGPCVANGEMGLSGKEGILVWSIRQGQWKHTPLDGLAVVAVVQAEKTLGDQRYQPRDGRAVLILDAKANTEQREALEDLARTMAGPLVKRIAAIKTAAIDASIGTCTGAGCASVKAGHLVTVSTRCLGEKDHLCGNEETFYPPLTPVEGAYPAYTELAQFEGDGLGLTWQAAGQRSAFLASFVR